MSQVTDYIIDNASGASVRSDLNLVFDAIKTLNSGGSDPANTEAFMPFVDTGDGNKLKIRNSSNNDFTTIGPVDTPNLGLLATTGGTMTGVLQLSNGSQSTPSLRFGDASTGLFRDFSNSVSFTSSGSKVFHVDSNGINIHSSKQLKWRDNDSSNFISFRAPNTISSNLSLTLPTADGTSGQALITNGSGTLSFGSPTVGAANLTGNTLASGVTASSLTSVGTLSSLAVSGTCTAGTFSGSGSSLTNIPAEQLTGTVADARISSLTSSKLSGALPAIDGSALTGISVSPNVVQNLVTSDFGTTSTSYQTAVSVTIDPVQTNSKILVIVVGAAIGAYGGNSSGQQATAMTTIFRGSTQVGKDMFHNKGNPLFSTPIGQSFLDTTSHGGNTVTYSLAIKKHSGGSRTVTLEAGSSIVVMEVT
jgi:hypothetical protein|tara:strand:+ start:419 stop:1678 length:1260 start_codon:yes stop_codon:yes gene_type:complete